MDIVYFTLGVLTVATLYAVVGVFKLSAQVKKLEDYTDSFNQSLSQLEENIYRDIRGNRDDISHKILEIYRQMDSRFDKLDHRIHQNIELVERNVYEQINDINRRLETKS
jgi:vacuolar-type H+-ATPase subunit B/Vma2